MHVSIPTPERLGQTTNKLKTSMDYVVINRSAGRVQSHPAFSGEGCHQAPHLLRGKILHAPSHLIGTGYQIFGGQLFLGVVAGVVAVFQPRRPPGLQILPKVALGGVLHDDIKRP